MPALVTQGCREQCCRVCFEVLAYQSGVLNALDLHRASLTPAEVRNLEAAQHQVRLHQSSNPSLSLSFPFLTWYLRLLTFHRLTAPWIALSLSLSLARALSLLKS